MNGDPHRLTKLEQRAIASYRSYSEYLLSLSDDDYEKYLAMPFTARLAVFCNLGLSVTDDQRVHVAGVPGGAYRGDQLAFLSA